MTENKYWWQDKFILSTFAAFRPGDDIEKSVELLSEAGLNAIECNTPLQYRAEDLPRAETIRALEACEKYGVRLFVTDHHRFTALPEPSLDDLKSVVDDYAHYPALGGYYVWDEPHTEYFPACRKMFDEFQKMDPQRLPLCASLPSYGPYEFPDAYPEHVSKFVEVVDPPVLSFDYYAVRKNEQGEDFPVHIETGIYRDLALWSDISVRTGKPLWFYVTSCWRSVFAKPTRATMSFQVYTAIAYGVKGIQYFMARNFTGGEVDFLDAPLDLNGKSDKYDVFKKFNQEIVALSPYLMRIKPKLIMHTAPIYDGCREFEPGYAGLVAADDNLVVAFHESDDSETYLIIVNKDANQPRKITLEFASPTALTSLPNCDVLRAENTISLDMEAGGGRVFKVSSD